MPPSKSSSASNPTISSSTTSTPTTSPCPCTNTTPAGGGAREDDHGETPGPSFLCDLFHRAAAIVVMSVIMLGSVIAWPFYFLNTMPWQRLERAKRIRATRENLADPESAYYRIGEHQVYYLQDVHTIPEAQKQALAHLEPNKNALGYREVLEVKEEFSEKEGKKLRKYVLTDYKWLTLAQVDERISTLEKAFRSLGVKEHAVVLIYAETRIEWFLCAHAVIRIGAAIATLYSTLGEEGLKHGMEETQASVVLTSEELLGRLPKPLLPRIKHVVYFPTLQNKPPPKQLTALTTTNKVEFLSYAELMAKGAKSKMPTYSLASTNIKEDDPAVILYTSGSTGKPKGVVLTHRNFVHTAKAIFTIITEEMVEAHERHSWYGFLPLAHILEFIAENTLFFSGIKIGYGSPFTMTDISTGIIKGQPGDLTLLKPTIIPAVPLVLERIRKTIFEKLQKRSPILNYLAYWLTDYKNYWIEHGYDTPFFDMLISSKFRKVFGGDVEYMLIGGAPLSSETQRMMRALLNVQILIGYGSSECSGGNLVMDLEDLEVGWTGAPLFGVKARIVDWPEGGYTHQDRPYPRGELHIGGHCVSKGYFAQEALTKEAFYQEKGVQWFRTGDIVAVHPMGLFKIIDRKKDLVKLQHGEYVSLGRIESELKNCLLVDNLCVHADSSHGYVVALIMPNWKVIKMQAVAFLAEMDAKSGNTSKSSVQVRVRSPSDLEPAKVEQVRTNPTFVSRILSQIQTFCQKETRLSKTEIPERIYLCAEEWTPANDLLTAALKIKRMNLLKFYAKEVEAMYAN